MREILYILIVVFVFIGCSNSESKYDLKGDWISVDSKYPLIITDSTIGFFGWGDFQKYWIKNDTIFFESRDKFTKDYSYLDSIDWKPMIIREVINGTDTLGRYAIENDKLILNDNYWENDTVKYYRLKKKSDLDFDSLLFETTMCNGTCPSMELKILSNGDFLFKGKAYTDKFGSYKGKLSQQLLDLINDKIDLLNFENYDSAYIAGYTDGQSRSLIIYHNGIREYLYVYGHEDEPAEINVVFHYLKEIYKWTELQKLDSELMFEEIEEIYPILPPPPTQEILDLIEDDKID